MHRIGYSLSNNGSYQIRKQPKGLLRKYFDLLRNSHSTVLVYADECELPVFGAFLILILNKNLWFLLRRHRWLRCLFCGKIATKAVSCSS